MIREPTFKISKRLYAVDLSSLQVITRESGSELTPRIHHVRVAAMWFRRRRGATVACVGTLWDIQRDPPPADVYEALARHEDGRYGGECEGRWDGENYWGAQAPAEIDRHLSLLRPMLDNYPDIPTGFDGWWRF